MPDSKSLETEKWKSKYFATLDKADKQSADWHRTEALLNKALSRIAIVAEGHSPQIDPHLQALRTVLKEKFDYFRLESVVTELLNIVTQVEKENRKTKKPNLINTTVIADILSAVDFPKSLIKKQKNLLKVIDKTPENITAITAEISQLLNEIAEQSNNKESSGLFGKLFSKSTKENEQLAQEKLAAALLKVPAPEQTKKEIKKIATAINICDDASTFIGLIESIESLTAAWNKELEKSKAESEVVVKSDGLVRQETNKSESIESHNKLDKQPGTSNTLSIFLDNLKSLKPESIELKSVEFSGEEKHDIDVLTSALLKLISSNKIISEPNESSNSAYPEIKELMIQLLEQIVVPIGLMKKAEEIKAYLESSDENDWQRTLKKVVHFINNVRINDNKGEENLEDFLQQITERLQEMVQYISAEAELAEKADGKSAEINTAVVNEVEGLRSGVENAASLNEIQNIVNQRLDAIGDYMLQHREFEKGRLVTTKDNLQEMQEKIELLETETSSLKTIIKQKNKEAMFDALTGIPNRLFYDKRVVEDVGRWKRFETPLSIAIWDVDKFKDVNDSYGHKAGDKVLKAIAQILHKRIRETDFLARYGGEEFVMLLPGTIEEETLRLANELRMAVEKCSFHYADEAVPITISCGISGFRPGDELTAVFERADQALYKAKDAGRNRCVIAACKSQ